MYCRIIAASFWCRGEKYNMFQNTVAYFFHGSTSAVRVLMINRMSASRGEHALRRRDEHVCGDHAAHDVLLVHHLHARVRVARRVVGVVADRRERLPALAPLVQHALHVTEITHESVKELLRVLQIDGALSHEQVRHVGERPVVQRVVVLRRRHAGVRHVVRELLDERDRVREAHAVRQRHHRHGENAGDFGRVGIDVAAFFSHLLEHAMEVRGGEGDGLLRERVPEDARRDQDVLRVVVAHLVPLAQSVTAVLQEGQEVEMAREIGEFRRGDGGDEPHDGTAESPLQRVDAVRELDLEVVAEVHQRVNQLLHHRLRRALAVLQVVDAVRALTVALGVVEAADVEVGEDGHFVEHAQQEETRRLREVVDHAEELKALFEDALLVLRVLRAVLETLAQMCW